MPPKKGKAKDQQTGNSSAGSIVRLLLQQEKTPKMSLRSEAESEEERETSESEEESTEEIVVVTPKGGIVDNNEIARLLETNFAEVKGDIKRINEKLTVNDGKIDKLNESMSHVSQRVETVSAENKTISESVDKNKEEIEKIIRQQNEFNTNYEKIMALANSLEQKEALIKHLQIRLEALEYENRKQKDKNEEWEQHSRKMNLWIYGVEESEKENTKQAVRDFCIKTLKLKANVVDSWWIKNTHRVGDPNNKKRPIIVAFVLWDDRQALLRSGKDLFQYNKDNSTTYAIKTDLAPRARQLRKDLYEVSNNMKDAEGCQSKVRDNPKGRVWLVKKQKKEDKKWEIVRHINPKYLPKGKSGLDMYSPPK